MRLGKFEVIIKSYTDGELKNTLTEHRVVYSNRDRSKYWIRRFNGGKDYVEKIDDNKFLVEYYAKRILIGRF